VCAVPESGAAQVAERKRPVAGPFLLISPGAPPFC
jgi:hypothetical protein